MKTSNKNKILLITVLLIILLGTYLFSRNKKSTTPDQFNIANNSYQQCVNEVDKLIKEREDNIKLCTREAIKNAGFNDDYDCIGAVVDVCGKDENDPACKICQSTERYNAEINGGNACLEKYPNNPKAKSLIECTSLLINN